MLEKPKFNFQRWDRIRAGDPGVLLSPSLLAANLVRIEEEVRAIAEEADLLHYDVMDGVFVPNISYGLPVLGDISKLGLLPNDVHLMIDDAALYIKDFAQAGAHIITVHPESSVHLHRTIQEIKQQDCLAGVVLNPGTSLSVLDAIIGDVDMVLLMSVNPGFGGQSFIPSTIHKIRSLRKMTASLEQPPLIEIDGGVDVTNAADIVAAGADILVAGSAVFGKADSAQAVRDLRREGERGLQLRDDN